MDMYKVKWTRLQTEIFRFLCIKAGQTFNLSEIARSLSVSSTAVSKALPELEKTGLINVERSKTMNLMSIELNRNDEKTIGLKRVENLRMIYESGLVDFFKDKFPGATIILFGSYSNGEDVSVKSEKGQDSDIDIAVVGKKEKNIELKEFDKKFGKKISVNFYDSFNKIHKHLKDSILNGILLSGSVEL